MDPHKILGVDKEATPEEIGRAYRRMAAKYHPDTGGDVWVFQQVNQAYAILTGKQPRRKSERRPTANQDSAPGQPQSQPPPEPRPEQSSTSSKTPQTESPVEPGPFHSTTFRAFPKRKKRKQSLHVHLIGASFGGVCALGVIFVLMKYQLAPSWATFQAAGVRSTETDPVDTNKTTRAPVPSTLPRGSTTGTSQRQPPNEKPKAPTATVLPAPKNDLLPSSDPKAAEMVKPSVNQPPPINLEVQKWLVEVLNPRAAERGDRLSVQEAIPELKKWLQEIEVADTKVKRQDAYKQVQKRLDVTLANSPIKLFFKVEEVSELDGGMFRIGIGECETALGAEIELKTPQYLDDRIGKQLAKEINLESYRIEVKGIPASDAIAPDQFASFFEVNFVFFYDQGGASTEAPIVVYLKKAKGRVFKPLEIKVEDAPRHVDDFVSMSFPVEAVHESSDGAWCALSWKKEIQSEGNFLVVIRNDPKISFRPSLPEHTGGLYLGKTIRVAGQLVDRSPNCFVMEVDTPDRIRRIEAPSL